MRTAVGARRRHHGEDAPVKIPGQEFTTQAPLRGIGATRDGGGAGESPLLQLFQFHRCLLAPNTGKMTSTVRAPIATISGGADFGRPALHFEAEGSICRNQVDRSWTRPSTRTR